MRLVGEDAPIGAPAPLAVAGKINAFQPAAAALGAIPKHFAERHHEAIFEAFRLEFYL